MLTIMYSSSFRRKTASSKSLNVILRAARFDVLGVGHNLLITEMNIDFRDIERGPGTLTFIKISSLTV